MKKVSVKFLMGNNESCDYLSLPEKMDMMNSNLSLSKKSYTYVSINDKINIGNFVVVRNGIYQDNSLIQLGIVVDILTNREACDDKYNTNPILSIFPSSEKIAENYRKLEKYDENNQKILVVKNNLRKIKEQNDENEHFRKLAKHNKTANKMYQKLLRLQNENM